MPDSAFSEADAFGGSDCESDRQILIDLQCVKVLAHPEFLWTPNGCWKPNRLQNCLNACVCVSLPAFCLLFWWVGVGIVGSSELWLIIWLIYCVFHSIVYSFCTYVLVYHVLCTSVLVVQFIVWPYGPFRESCSAIPIHFITPGACLGGGGCSVGACIGQVPTALPKPRRMHQRIHAPYLAFLYIN